MSLKANKKVYSFRFFTRKFQYHFSPSCVSSAESVVTVAQRCVLSVVASIIQNNKTKQKKNQIK